MADDTVLVNPGSKSNAIKIALEKIGDIFYPIYKVAFGVDGSRTLVDSENGLPVSITDDYLIKVARGLVPGHRIVHKFGHGIAGTNPTPVTSSGFWRTPIAPVALEFLSDNINDSAGGSGACQNLERMLMKRQRRTTEH